MLYAACDPARYAGLGAPASHRSCAGNLDEALRGQGLQPDHGAPAAQHLHGCPAQSGRHDRLRPGLHAGPGTYIAFQAAQDCLVVLSSCPMDIVPISTGGITPLELQVYETTTGP